MFQSVLYSLSRSMVLTLIALSVLSVSFAQVRTSSNYTLQSDSINIGGGLSSSTNYTQESTVGEIATGRSASSNYQLRAGYQQMQEVFLSLTPPSNVDMDIDLPGITGGTSNGSTSFAVLTDSPSGYVVTLSAEADPAMQRMAGGETIANYPAGTTPDFTFNVGPANAYFGYTVEGSDITSNFKDNGSLCNVGGSDAVDACWRSLTQADFNIARSGSSNQPNAASTTLKFRVGIGSGAGVIAGTYVATSTITALPL